MNNQKGFTLIELIVVIVILGILSAVAVPKFVDMQGEAKKGVLEGVRGSLKSAVMMAHGKCLVTNTTGAATIDVEGENVDVNFGYPNATEANVPKLVDLDKLTSDAEFTVVETAAGAGAAAFVTVTYGSYSFKYTATTATTTPPVVSTVSP